MKHLPADFLARAAEMNNRQLGSHYRVGAPCINLWRKQSGIHTARRKRPIPADFAEYAPNLTVNACCERWVATHDTVKRWLSEAGIRRFTVAQGNIPADFRECAGQPTSDLAEKYGVAASTIIKWRARLGIPHPPSRRQQTPTRRVPASKPVRAKGRPLPMVTVPQIEGSCAAMAAQFLRRFYAPVVKSEVIGKEKGKYLVGGKGLIEIHDLLALAEARGWDARSWARLSS